MRIVSLLPSATEILFALGAGDDVLGVTFECDYPPDAASRTIVSTSTLADGLASAEIDAAVVAAVSSGQDLYQLDEVALGRIDPELVVTQGLCAVCAPDAANVQTTLTALRSAAEILTLDPHSLAEVLATIADVGSATGHPAEAVALVADLTRRLDAVAAGVHGLKPVRALVLEWTDPPFAPGHWVPDLVQRAGGTSVLGRAGAKSERTDWHAVRESAPEVIVCAPCGFGLDTAVALAQAAVGSGVLPTIVPVWAVDANASFARPGPRLIDGVETLASIFHPDAIATLNPAAAQQIR